MAQLCQYQDELKQLNTEVLIVTFGAPPLARTGLEETRVPFRPLLDPEREVNHTWCLESTLLRSWNLKTVGYYLKMMRKGRQWRGIQGDSSQLGGDFVVDSRRHQTSGLPEPGCHGSFVGRATALRSWAAGRRGMIRLRLA